MLLFDFNNIRYVTSTHIGEWALDKMTRYALQTRGGSPHIWDFGSAAKHHRLNCPWLAQDNIHAGMVGLRGAVAPDAGLFRRAAREICEILKAEGVLDMPLGVDIVEPRCWPLEAEGTSGTPAGGSTPASQIDRQIMLLNTACRWSTAPTDALRAPRARRP
jgi:Xaa-Pro dipeptidase